MAFVRICQRKAVGQDLQSLDPGYIQTDSITTGWVMSSPSATIMAESSFECLICPTTAHRFGHSDEQIEPASIGDLPLWLKVFAWGARELEEGNLKWEPVIWDFFGHLFLRYLYLHRFHSNARAKTGIAPRAASPGKVMPLETHLLFLVYYLKNRIGAG